jgi:cell division cycle protein 20 (cofactor of APC complex)
MTFNVNSANQENANPATKNNSSNNSNIAAGTIQGATSTAASVSGGGVLTPSKEEYRARLADTLLQGVQKKRVFSFQDEAVRGLESVQNTVRTLHTPEDTRASKKVKTRFVPKSPERVLDAPYLRDDYYLNLLDWSSKNILAVALGTTVYLWNADTGQITELMSTTDAEDYVSSVGWMDDGYHLAIGTNTAQVQIWDCEKIKQVRTMRGHTGRVSSLAPNKARPWMVSSGGRDSKIINHDVRSATNTTQVNEQHTQEVCGLKWSPNGRQLASGGNDNMLCVWDEGVAQARLVLEYHVAAVKALAWCPFQTNVLASGGGTADRRIAIWNTTSGVCTLEKDTNSQVCSLVWSVSAKELLSSHGFTNNQLCLWSYPSMNKITELTGHTSRVLHMSLSPDGETVVSAAADETLRFWKVFASSHKGRRNRRGSGQTPLGPDETSPMLRCADIR